MNTGPIDFLVNLAMFSMMFGMGLTLKASDFRRIAAAPIPVIVGTAIQLLLMPLLGMAIAKAFELPPLLAMGLIVMAALPGGMFSNMYVHVAKGNTALSVTLTATATLVTLFTLPLWMQFALADAGGLEGTSEVPILDTALQLAMLTVVPVALGMALRHVRPSTAHWERRLTVPALIGIVVGVALKGSEQPEPPTAEFMLCLAPVLTYAFGALAIGLLVPRLFGISARDTVTLTLELVVKNTLLGLVLLAQGIDFLASVPILVFIVFQTPVGIFLLVGWRMLAKAGWIESIDDSIESEAPIRNAG